MGTHAVDETSPWRPFETRRHERDAKREAVLRTTARFFVERGYHRTTMADVAAHLNVTKPTLYHYFRGKEEILLECYRLGDEMIAAELRRIAASGETGRGKVMAFVRAYTEIMTVDFGMLLVRAELGDLSAESHRQIAARKRRIDHQLRGFVMEGMADGSVAATDPKIATYMLAGALNWIGHWYRPDGGLGPEEIAARAIELFELGLKPRTDGAAGRQRTGRRGKP